MNAYDRTRSPPDSLGAQAPQGGVGLILLLVALTEGNAWGWGSAKLIGMVTAGLGVLVVWGDVEARTASPMVDMRMLSRRPVLFTNLAALFCGFTMYAIFTVLPLFSQMPRGLPDEVAGLVDYGSGATVTVSALHLLPGALVMLPAGPFGGILGRWVGFKAALAMGLIVTAPARPPWRPSTRSRGSSCSGTPSAQRASPSRSARCPSSSPTPSAPPRPASRPA